MLIPVFMVALLGNIDHGDLIAVVVFSVAAATDSLDGYLARSRQSITTVGKLLDPLADKLLISATQDVVISASIWGKVKTTVQVAAIIALIVDDPPHTVTTVLVACAVAVTIWSGIEYFIAGRDILREPA